MIGDVFGWEKRDRRAAAYQQQEDANRSRARTLLEKYMAAEPVPDQQMEPCLCGVKRPALFCGDVWRCAFCFHVATPPSFARDAVH